MSTVAGVLKKQKRSQIHIEILLKMCNINTKLSLEGLEAHCSSQHIPYSYLPPQLCTVSCEQMCSMAEYLSH